MDNKQWSQIKTKPFCSQIK